jgi:hypothetical protein
MLEVAGTSKGQRRRIGVTLNDYLQGLPQLLRRLIQSSSIEQPWITIRHLAIPAARSHSERLIKCARRGDK